MCFLCASSQASGLACNPRLLLFLSKPWLASSTQCWVAHGLLICNMGVYNVLEIQPRRGVPEAVLMTE